MRLGARTPVVGAFKSNLDPVQSNAPHKCPEVSKHVPSSRQKLLRNTCGVNYMYACRTQWPLTPHLFCESVPRLRLT